MAYIMAIIIIVSAIYLWLTNPAKITYVRPVKNGKIMDDLLSVKPRWKVIRENDGWKIGLLIGFVIGVFLAYVM